MLNLQITTDKDSLNIDLGGIAAQDLKREQQSSFEVGSDIKKCCKYCLSPISEAWLAAHESDCPAKPKPSKTCSDCGISYTESHDCKFNAGCIKCKQSADKCTCKGVVVTGKQPSSNSVVDDLSKISQNGGFIPINIPLTPIQQEDNSYIPNGLSSVLEYNNNQGFLYINRPQQDDSNLQYFGGVHTTVYNFKQVSPDNYTGENPRISMDKLFKRVAEKDPTLKLLPNLPNTLIKQELKGECVVRALAFIMDYLKLKGNASYKSIYGNLKNIALADSRCDILLRKKGVPIYPPDMIDTIFKNYCGKVYNIPNYPSNIQKYIDAGIPVAIGKIEKDGVKHMVTVIGYDNDNFYVAAGNQDGTANIIPKSESGHTFIYSLIHL